MRMINPASVHDIIIFYLRNICAITKTQFTIQNALLRNNQTARGHVEKNIFTFLPSTTDLYNDSGSRGYR